MIRLTPRQQEILELVAEGLTSPQIARRLSRSVRTVESHRLKIGRLLGAKNPADLIQKARQAKLLQSGDTTGLLTGATDDSASLEHMLNALGTAATTSGSGKSLLRSICNHIVTAFNVECAVISRVTESDEVQAAASWSRRGELSLPAWNFSTSPCARLGWGEVVTIPYRDLPSSMAKSFESICNDDSSLTIVPVRREVDMQIGVLCLVHAGERDLAKISRSILLLCSAWISSELTSSVYRKELEAAGFELGEADFHDNSLSFRCDADGQLTWISTRLPDIADEMPVSSTRDIFTLLQAVADNVDSERLEQLRESIFTEEAFSASFPCKKHPLGDMYVRFNLQPVIVRNGRSDGFIGFMDLASRSRHSLDESMFLGALQLLVSKHPDPCIMVDWSGDIIAASSAWRDHIRDHKLVGTAECGNYLSILQRTGYSDIAESIQHALLCVVENSSQNMLRLPFVAEGELSKLGSIVELTAIPGSQTIFINHIPESPGKLDVSPSISYSNAIPNHSGDLLVQNATHQCIVPMHAFDWVFSHSQYVMCICTLEGILHKANPAMYKAFECTAADLNGKRFFDLFYPQDHVYVQELVNRLSSGRPVDQSVLPMKTLRGNRILLEWTCPPVLPGTDLFTPMGRVL